MAGIYIHIPFCKKACHYCDFHFSTNLNLKEDLIQGILKEIELRKDFFTSGITVETIYLGGGTPSILRPRELELILSAVHNTFNITQAEVTIETNPDDITTSNLEAWHQLGINRISLGIQTFHDETLVFMNRNHTSQKAIEAISLIKKSAFSNLSLDLIFGTHGTSMEIFLSDLTRFIEIRPEHISAYCLTIEEETTFGKWFKQNKLPEVDQELTSRQYLAILDQLARAGYMQYEISNFALPGYESKHNSSYWQDKHFLGLGPSAHSYDRQYRYENIKPNATYIKKINQGSDYYTAEFIRPETHFNETILTQLRKNVGLNLQDIKTRFPNFWNTDTQHKLEKHLKDNLVFMDNEFVKLTRNGKLYADSICEDLLYLK